MLILHVRVQVASYPRVSRVRQCTFPKVDARFVEDPRTLFRFLRELQADCAIKAVSLKAKSLAAVVNWHFRESDRML